MNNLLFYIGAAVILLGSFIFGTQIVVHQPTQQFEPKAGAFNPTGGGTYYLQASINSSQTTITLTSFTEPSSGIPYTMSYLNSSIEYGTINPNSPTSEFISFTGITQNTNGTALLTGVTRGLGRSYPYTASTTLAHSVPGQTQFILSAPPQFYNQYYVLQNNATSSGILTFGSTTPPQYDADPVWGNFSTRVLADVSYVNSVVAGGAANASETVKGIVQLATALQSASSTSVGSTAARLALGSNLSTSTPGLSTVTGDLPALTGSKLNQLFLDLTQAFTFSTTTVYNANFGRMVATSTIASIINYASTTAITATTASSTNLVTSNLVTLPNGCVGCTITAVISTSTTFTGPTSNTGQTSGTALCVSPKIVSGGGYSGLSPGASNVPNDIAIASNPSGTNGWTTTVACQNSGGCSGVTITVYALCVNP